MMPAESFLERGAAANPTFQQRTNPESKRRSVNVSLIDAGPLIAIFDKSDQFHNSVLSFLKEYHGRLITTWPVITEVSHILNFSRQTQVDFLDWIIKGGLAIHHIEPIHLVRIREWFVTYSNLPADLADCTLLEVAESENIHSIITLDRDFAVYKLSDGKYLRNLIQDLRMDG